LDKLRKELMLFKLFFTPGARKKTSLIFEQHLNN
jgi:hypothetical protein